MRRSTRRPANGPLVTCPPLARKSVISALVIAANAARGSGSVMDTIVPGSPDRAVGASLGSAPSLDTAEGAGSGGCEPNQPLACQAVPDLALVVGEVPPDHGEVKLPKDRLLRLALQQEGE